MPIDVSGFTQGEQSFGGLYKIADDKRQSREFEEREADRRLLMQEKQDAKKTASAEYFQHYLDPKHYTTGVEGSGFGSVITEGLSDVLKQSMGLISQGLDNAQITGIIAPKVGELSKASENLQTIEAQRKASNDQLKSVKGVDMAKFDPAFSQTAYFNPDGTRKSIEEIAKSDPTQPYADNVLRTADVYNDEGINDFVKTAGHEQIGQKIKTRDAHGKVHDVTVDINKPSFMVSDVDAQGVHKDFVPDFKELTDGDGALMHTFKDENGKDVNAPVRVVKDYVWDGMPNTAKGKILQEVRGLLKQHPDAGVSIGSPQAEYLAKAIAYDKLKDNAKGWSSMKRVDVNLQPLPPRVSVSVNNGAEAAKTVNLYQDVQNVVEAPKRNKFQATGMDQIPSQAKDILIEVGRNSENDKSLSDKDFYLTNGANGTIELWRKTNDIKTDRHITTVNENQLNVPVNIQAGKTQTNKQKIAGMRDIPIGTGGGKTAAPSKTAKGLPIFK